VARQVTEQVSAQVAGNADERRVCNQAGQAPQPAIRRDECNEQSERWPCAGHAIAWARQSIDEKLNAVLRAHRASDRGEDCGQDCGVRSPTLMDESECKGDWTVGVPTDIAYCRDRRKIRRFHGPPQSCVSELHRNHHGKYEAFMLPAGKN
jgi:hypothetical protein